VVEKVEVSQAGVQWLAWGVGASRDPPPAWASVKEIDILTAFAGLTRVGDHVCGSDLPDGSCAQVIRTETRCSVRWSSSEDSPEVASLQLVPSCVEIKLRAPHAIDASFRSCVCAMAWR
jgi:hypothetical protein